MRIERGDERQGLHKPGHAAALGGVEETLQLRRRSALAQVQEQRDASRHLPIVVEVPGRLEPGHLAVAVERRGARLPQRFRHRAPGGLLGHRVVAGARIEQHAVDVEDHGPDP